MTVFYTLRSFGHISSYTQLTCALISKLVYLVLRISFSLWPNTLHLSRYRAVLCVLSTNLTVLNFKHLLRRTPNSKSQAKSFNKLKRSVKKLQNFRAMCPTPGFELPPLWHCRNSVVLRKLSLKSVGSLVFKSNTSTLFEKRWRCFVF